MAGRGDETGARWHIVLNVSGPERQNPSLEELQQQLAALDGDDVLEVLALRLASLKDESLSARREPIWARVEADLARDGLWPATEADQADGSANDTNASGK